MKTKLDILNAYSQFFGEYDTVLIDEVIGNGETQMEGISVYLTRRNYTQFPLYINILFQY